MAYLLPFLGALLFVGVFTQFTKWAGRKLLKTHPPPVASNAISLVLAVLLYALLDAEGPSVGFTKIGDILMVYVPAQMVWLAIDLYRSRRSAVQIS